MKERPILFSDAMVRAILDGRKTQTRRVVKRPKKASLVYDYYEGDRWWIGPHPSGNGFWAIDVPSGPDEALIRTTGSSGFPAPYGVGDLLWVRESHYRFGHWEPRTGQKARTRKGRQRWRFVPDLDEIRYEAPEQFRKGRHSKDPATPAWHKRLARFMPKSASRITLEVTGVRVERVQAISEADAIADGCMAQTFQSHTVMTARDAYRVLWDTINGSGSWAANPWVWVVEFKRVEKGGA